MKFSLALLAIMAFCPLVASSDVLISHLRIKAPIPGQSVSAAYFEIENKGEELVRLLSVRSLSADKVSMHDHQMKEGMMAMIELDSIALAAGEKTVFEEGGRHLMVYSPDKHVIESGEMEFAFEFSDGSEIMQIARTEFLVPQQNGAPHHH